MRKISLIIVLALGWGAFAQQDAIYSQYQFNQFVINPAYAGSRNSMSALLLHRSRWTGVPGAPTTQTASIHSTLNHSRVAWGINAGRDQLGPTTHLLFAFSGAYHLPLQKGKLSFGLRAGLFNSFLNSSKLELRDPTDQLNLTANQNAMRLGFDFGIYYYSQHFYAGLTLNHLNSGKFAYNGLQNAAYFLRRFNTLGMGYVAEITDNLALKPSFMLRSSGSNAYRVTSVDLSLSALFYKRVWLGVSFRSQTAINFLLELNITDYLRVGYAYDSFLNQINQFSNGAHELFVGFDFNTNKVPSVSPRYL